MYSNMNYFFYVFITEFFIPFIYFGTSIQKLLQSISRIENFKIQINYFFEHLWY